jgi:hypothetical protein
MLAKPLEKPIMKDELYTVLLQKICTRWSLQLLNIGIT